MTELLGLAELQDDDRELVPSILPVDARLVATGPVESFKRLFERAASVVPEKEAIPGTGFALLTVTGATRSSLAYLSVAATDGELSVQVQVDGFEVRLPGVSLVPPKKILKILAMAPTQKASLSVYGNTLTIRSGRAQWTVQLPVGDHLPPRPDVSRIPMTEVDADDLIPALAAALKASSHTSSRTALMQVLFNNGSITGMDGSRLHQATVPSMSVILETTLPNKAAAEILALIKGTTDNVYVGANQSHFVIQVGHNTLIAQKLLLPFPQHIALTTGPAMTNPHRLTVARQELIEAIKRVRINADPDFMVVLLALAPGRLAADGPTWDLKVSAKDKVGNAAIEVLSAMWDGPAGGKVLVFQHHHLIELLEAASSDEMITLRLGDDTTSTRLPLFIDTDSFVGWVQQVLPGFLG